jgi:hypothetical protein
MSRAGRSSIVYASPIASHASYVEVYVESFPGSSAAQLSALIAAFFYLSSGLFR